MSSSSNDEAPWADLLPDLYSLVVDRLDALSLLRAPAVCTSWAAVCAATPRLRPGGPALVTSRMEDDVYHCADDNDGDDGCAFAVHDVSTGKSFRAEAEGLENRCWIGGKDDWLVTTDAQCNAELLNPLTGARLRLPSFDTIPGVQVIENVDLYVRYDGRNYRFERVILCQTPAHKKGYLAVAIFAPDLLAFTAAGDECWTALKIPAGASRSMEYADAIAHKGKVFAVTSSGHVSSWDMDGATAEPILVQPPEIQISRRLVCRWNLATSSGGQPLLVCTYGKRISNLRRKRSNRMLRVDECRFDARGISLHELDEDSGHWQRVSCLGDRALFLGLSYPFSVAVPRGGGSKDLKANCVYVACMSGYDAAIFDLEGDDFDFEPLLYPNSDDGLQTPMWFRPVAL